MTMTDHATNGVDDPQSLDHHFASVNGIRMHYVEEGEGPLVVLLHGYPFLWYLWRHQIKSLAAAGYRVVAPDQRGYGQTDFPEGAGSYDMTRLVGDVVGLINAVGSDSAVVVGQDWGSPVSYNAALMRPDLVRGVLMMCAPPAARGAIRPSDAMRQVYRGLILYYPSHHRVRMMRGLAASVIVAEPRSLIVDHLAGRRRPPETEREEG